MLQSLFNRHKRVLLQLSPGKDSAACLKLLLPWKEQVDVVWVNQGNPYPEVLDYMRAIKAKVPHFYEILGNQPEFIAHFGHPVDVVPFECTEPGRLTYRDTGPKMVSMHFCCSYNLWEPMHRTVKELGATCVVRGEKRADVPRSTCEPGIIFEGVEYALPVWEWSDAEIMEFLGNDAPPWYKQGRHASLDCMNCTAHLASDPGRIQALHDSYPKVYQEVRPVLVHLHNRLKRHLSTLNEVL